MRRSPGARPASRSARVVCLALCFLFASSLPAQESPPAAPVTDASAAESLPASAPSPVLVGVVFQTSLGDIRVDLEPDRAPVTVANFLRYVDAKRFDGITWYRALKLDPDGKYGLVQGGLRGDRKKAFKPIAHESPSVTGLRHVDGAISMARLEPGSATADFFVIIGDLVSLDGTADGSDPGYAVFGRVTQGMDILRPMLDLPRDPNAGEGAMKGQMLAQPVKVLTVRRVAPAGT
jgi:peptidyl-prolyl cis-trans isomerase A (cyclophilin A)